MSIHGRPWDRKRRTFENILEWSIVIVIGAFLIFGVCAYIYSWTNTDKQHDDPLIVESWHNGHLYLQSLRVNGGGALTHSPDCPKCFKKKEN